MVAAALAKKRGEDGERLFSDVRIEEYVNQIREMGIEQSFIRRECYIPSDIGGII